MQPAAYANFNLPKLNYDVELCNLYRDGNDSAGFHAEAEPGGPLSPRSVLARSAFIGSSE